MKLWNYEIKILVCFCHTLCCRLCFFSKNTEPVMIKINKISTRCSGKWTSLQVFWTAQKNAAFGCFTSLFLYRTTISSHSSASESGAFLGKFWRRQPTHKKKNRFYFPMFDILPFFPLSTLFAQQIDNILLYKKFSLKQDMTASLYSCLPFSIIVLFLNQQINNKAFF